MGLVNKLSAALTKRDAKPQQLADAIIAGGMVREAVGVVALEATDSSASTVRFAQVPSNARISQILLSCTDSGTAGAMDIGIYKSIQDGGAVVDADFFSAAKVLTTALVNADVTKDNQTAFPLTESEYPLWKALGLTEDPKINYDITGTLTAACELAATVELKAKYVI